MKGGIRRRLIVLFTSFTGAIGVVAIAAVLTVYHRVEDGFVERRLEEALGSSIDGGADESRAGAPSVVYVGRVEAAPEPYAALLETAEPGRYEWELEGREAHALVTSDPVARVAIYSVPEVEARERLVELGLWSAFGALFLLGLLLARSLAVRAVEPVERLTARIADEGLGVLPVRGPAGPEAEGFGSDEVDLLAAALDDAGSRLHASIERERRFLREASHELRTPVTVIQGAYDLLDEHLDPADEANRRRLERIGRSLRRIDLSISSLLAIARVEHEAALPGTAGEEALADVIAEARSLAPPEVELTLEIADRRAVESSPTTPFLAVALSNLLRNALANTTAGRVNVRLGSAELVVEDTGRGFDGAQLVPRDGSGPAPGFGLGLATVDRICERCGWRLELENRPGRTTGRAPVAGARATIRFEPTRG